VAGGRTIEFVYGEAAALPVRVAEDAIERILVNLVRNAARALEDIPSESRMEGPGIRIGVGLLVHGIGEPKPWPFRHVRLTVEDSGCGMTAERLGQLVSGLLPVTEDHGIGFRVVQELVAASEGDLQVVSVPGAGTRVQIEWPIAPVSLTQTPEFRQRCIDVVPSQPRHGAPANSSHAADRIQVSNPGAGRWLSC
jgi:signal transduction histidine kinase